LLYATAAIGTIAATWWDQPWAYIMPRWYFPGLDVSAAYINTLPLTVLAAFIGIACGAVLSRSLANTHQ
jgi:hypothetical protein